MTRKDTTLARPDGRTVAYIEGGDPNGHDVLWFHGAATGRLEALAATRADEGGGLRIVGFDRSGYGGSSPHPGRSITDSVDDALAVADALGMDQFATVGVSTGGPYALATAATAPNRVKAVVVAAGMSDMSVAALRAHMVDGASQEIWAASSREEAIGYAEQAFGINGERLLDNTGEPAPADLELFSDPAVMEAFGEMLSQGFAQGVLGIVDDRAADGPGWSGFDVTKIRCPVVVLHGAADTTVPLAQAMHTAAVVPGARLDVREGYGHVSMASGVPDVLRDLLTP